MTLLGGGEHRRRDRGDDERQADAEDQDRREDAARGRSSPARRGSAAAIPAAITSGPTVSGIRGPIRCASAPERAENTSISAVTGSDAAPASIGE